MNIAALHHKKVIACVVVFLFFSLHPFNASGQDNPALTGRLQVGVMNVPPFIMKTVDGQWEGLSIELWRMIARDLELEFELQEYSSIQQVHDALENRVLDIVPTAAVTASREIVLDFSNPYYRSGSAIAVPVESTDFHWFRLVERFFSSNFMKAMGYLTLLLLFVGAVVWMFEHRRNRDMFGERPVEGIGHGVWWAAVTMTTVGYGDKAPQTLGGRMAAIVWMMVSIVLVSVLTASITTSLTISELSGKVRGVGDLHSVRVGSLEHSTALNRLVESGITVLPFANEQEGLQAIVDNQIDAFVINQAVLKYLVVRQFPGQLRVLPDMFNPYYVSMVMPSGSPLREQINRSLLKVMATTDWLKLMDRYLGPGR
jgi:polar amino acid transport system substrate-binding protein